MKKVYDILRHDELMSWYVRRKCGRMLAKGRFAQGAFGREQPAESCNNPEYIK